jgi:hypothetical protein
VQPRQEARWRDRVAATAGLLALLQLLGTLQWLTWTPAMLFEGGFDRFIDFGKALDLRVAHAAQTLFDALWVLYFAALGLAASRLSRCAPPAAQPGAEVGRLCRQRRRVWSAQVGAVLVVHGLGQALSLAGWWPLAALLEMTAHTGAAALIWVLAVPEARCALVVIRDQAHKGLNNRLHYGIPGRFGQFRWVDVHHRRFKGVKVFDTLWQRLLGLASLELAYLDEHGSLCRVCLRAVASKEEAAAVAGFLAGEFRIRDQYLPPQAPRMGHSGQAGAPSAPVLSTDLEPGF